MAVTVENSGTVTTDGTEQTLGAAITTAKVLSLLIDTAALTNGDTLQVTVYGKVLSGGTEHIVFQDEFADVQAEPIKVVVPVPSPISWKATVKRTGGSDRAHPWSIVSV